MVELRVFEGEGSNKTDVTFSYNAHFFCFATLEHAPRTMVSGRSQNIGQQQQPVLTGMPVSGMAYLDRPAEAGYFIFPDLSVRHEGLYVLDFTLYEQTKDAKDQDPEESSKTDEAEQPMPAGSFDYRLNVKSMPFTVFSAKKFPGLAESTMLSRTVAEQGCRVRIRRDVRMRRREGKGDGFDDFDDPNYARGRSATPQSEYNRQRSISNNDRQRFDHRRQSNAYEDPTHYNPPANFNAPSIEAGPSSSSLLRFGSQSAAQSQFQTPQFAQPPSAPSQQYSSNSVAYQQPSQYRQSQPQNYGYQERPSFSSNDYRRPSSFAGPLSAKPEHDSRSTYQPYARPEPPKLAPLQAALQPQKYEAMPLSASNRTTTVASPTMYHDRPSYNSFSAPSHTEQRTSTKRSFDSVFPNAASYNQPLHNGMRPTSSHGPKSNHDSLDAKYDEYAAYNMNYRRADSTTIRKQVPLA